jgi:CheY-like chemotaxis protein
VACASRLSEAQELAHLDSLEVIVVDPTLADASAEEVNRFVTARFGARVVVSSLGSRSEGTRGRPRAMFVSKPIDRARLLTRIRVARRLENERLALLVEPNDDDASNVRALLADAGFEILAAHDLAEARTHLGARPTVAVIELALPDGDGSSLLDELSAAGAAVIVLTGRELADHERSSLQTRARWVAQKGRLSREAFSGYLSELSRARKRVLAVDDNEQNLRLLTTLLGSRGYDVIEARSAASALDLARTREPDVILMDVMLPDRDGLSVTRELKARDSTKRIPIIAVTAQAMAGDAQLARAAGCVDHIPKPIDRKLLLQAIERATTDVVDERQQTRREREHHPDTL